jgi:hypothetical protein
MIYDDKAHKNASYEDARQVADWLKKNKPRLLPSATADGAIPLGNLFRRQAGIPTQGGSKRTHGGKAGN